MLFRSALQQAGERGRRRDPERRCSTQRRSDRQRSVGEPSVKDQLRLELTHAPLLGFESAISQARPALIARLRVHSPAQRLGFWHAGR